MIRLGCRRRVAPATLSSARIKDDALRMRGGSVATAPCVKSYGEDLREHVPIDLEGRPASLCDKALQPLGAIV